MRLRRSFERAFLCCSAAYDKKERQLQYSTGKLVIPQQPPPHLVEFTEPNESVSLRVTPDHDMFVQLGEEDSHRYRKMPAEWSAVG